MNCKVFQYRALNLEAVDQPPAELADHLGDCVACRDWLHQLQQVERQVALLPVPASGGKARLLKRVLAGPAEAPRLPKKQSAPEPAWAARERRLKRLAVSSALTAALVLVAVGLLAWRQSGQPEVVKKPLGDDPLVRNLVQRNVNLASASTARDKLNELATMADDLQKQTLTLAHVADPGDLSALAGLYQDVVEQGIVTRAKALPAGERSAVLGRIADRLKEAGTQADEMAGRVPAESAEALRTIAAAAQNGNKELQVLLLGRSS